MIVSFLAIPSLQYLSRNTFLAMTFLRYSSNTDNKTKESITGVIDLSDEKLALVEAMLRFIYEMCKLSVTSFLPRS